MARESKWREVVEAAVAEGKITFRQPAVEAVVEQFHGVKRAAVVGESYEDATENLIAELESIAPGGPQKG